MSETEEDRQEVTTPTGSPQRLTETILTALGAKEATAATLPFDVVAVGENIIADDIRVPHGRYVQAVRDWVIAVCVQNRLMYSYEFDRGVYLFRRASS